MKTFKITILFAFLIFTCANVSAQNLEGKYYPNTAEKKPIVISKVTGKDFSYTITGDDGWVGMGYYDKVSKRYLGSWIYPPTNKRNAVKGAHNIKVLSNGTLSVEIISWNKQGEQEKTIIEWFKVEN